MNGTSVNARASLLTGGIIVYPPQVVEGDVTKRNMEYVDDKTTIDITFKYTFTADTSLESMAGEAEFYTKMFMDMSMKTNKDTEEILRLLKDSFINGSSKVLS